MRCNFDGARLALTCLAGTALALAMPAAAQKPAETASIEEQRRYFTEDAVAPMVRPAAYDVTIVEYMDYQCPNCRTSVAPIRQLLASDRKVRLIYRDWPIFGPASEGAALVALAAKYQGKYREVHEALMAAPLPLDEKRIEAAARGAGVDWPRLEKDMNSHSAEILALLRRNDEQAQSLGLQGTPGFLVGNTQFFGGMTLKELKEAVAKARSAGTSSVARAR